MSVRDVYLRIETIPGYSPVEPDDHVSPPIKYRRDCMRTMGHEDGTIPADEVNARRLTALIYREYLDAGYLVPKPDKLVASDINEPAFMRRVPGTVIYAHPGERLRMHVKNADSRPHSLHVHGLRYGIDSDGSWPMGTQSADGRRSDEICTGQSWTYTFDVIEEMIGAWPFHDHCHDIGTYINRGLFGGIVVLGEEDHACLPGFPMPSGLRELMPRLLDFRPPPDTPPSSETGPMPMGAMSMTMTPAAAPHPPRHVRGVDPDALPDEVLQYVVLLDELAHAPQPALFPKPPHPIRVPLFLHQMSGARGTPVFQSAPLMAGSSYPSAPFSLAATYGYYCGIHGVSMSATVHVTAGGPSTASVSIVDNQFIPADVTVGVGGTVTWTNNGPSLHSVVERGGDNIPSFCLNGRSFVGNTPTILAHAGQKICWYVFNLDLGMAWHNFHPHGQRWSFAEQEIDIRSIGPAESFVVETVAPPVLLLPEHIHSCQEPGERHAKARPYHLRGDFLVHCHVEMHMMAGLVGVVRSQQTVWLTPHHKAEVEAQTGLPVDTGDNACSAVHLDRCAKAVGGRWEVLPGLPQITMMHTLPLAGTDRVLFWGYGPRSDQSRVWDQTTGLYTQPAIQPQALAADANIWSGAHAQLDDAQGTILAHGGFINQRDPNPPHAPTPPLTEDTERRAFLFSPSTSTWSRTADTHVGRFYPTTVSLPDGRALTLFGQNNAGGGATAASLEVYTPGGAGSWSAPKPVPFNYFYYPWTFLLPGGDLFVAGPQKPARRFDWTLTPIVDAPARRYQQIYDQRGVNMDGTALMLPLRPGSYAPRILIAGGATAAVNQKAEWIDLSATTPAWQALPDLNIPRDKVNSVLLPDGRVIIVGGIETLPNGGPVEIFDPEDPTSGFQLGPEMAHARGYHSTATLLRDGSVLVGGDPNGGSTPCERYLPSYFSRPRPPITSAPPGVSHGAPLAIGTPVPGDIEEVVLMRPAALTHGFNQNQRLIECVITGTAGGAVHATAPPDHNLAPHGHYLLFIIDRDRVPSLGAWLRLS